MNTGAVGHVTLRRLGMLKSGTQMSPNQGASLHQGKLQPKSMYPCICPTVQTVE